MDAKDTAKVEDARKFLGEVYDQLQLDLPSEEWQYITEVKPREDEISFSFEFRGVIVFYGAGFSHLRLTFPDGFSARLFQGSRDRLPTAKRIAEAIIALQRCVEI